MGRMTLLVAVLAVAVVPADSRADWGGAAPFKGSQPWYNIFAKRHANLTPEEEKLQQFWHDYYDSLRQYYQEIDHIDWVQYYKNHGYQMSPGCAGPGCNRINYAPVFVSPSMQWATPATAPPATPPAKPMAATGFPAWAIPRTYPPGAPAGSTPRK